MEKNQNFFDPYNFSTKPMQNIPQNNIQQDYMPQGVDQGLLPMNPAMYYEQQYMYYKYLTQVLEYKIKLKEWENIKDKK